MIHSRQAKHEASSNLSSPQSLSRRHVLAAAVGLLASPAFARARRLDAADELKALESRAGGRLGVCILDTASGRHVGNRMDERFAMCSTFKLPLAAIVLREADGGRLRLTDTIRFSKKDLVPHAPVTSRHLDTGVMTVGALAEAAQVTSDNVAANLLLKKLGGPAAFTRLLRAAGDQHTRLDRMEPALNLVLPGEEHDTTTPRAMAETTSRFLTGDLLSPSSRELLISWMVATETGTRRIRAGLPAGWRAGDKTGTASADTMTDKINDVAIAWPTGRAPIVVTAYFDAATRSESISSEQEAVLADVGRIAARNEL
jgi:beta-lactamase class A